MTRKELEKKFEELSTAIENHDYKAFYREPGGVRECLSPDDKLIVQVYDLDGPSHSADFGGISVTVKGESFDCDLSKNEWSGSLFDEIDEEFGEDDEELAEELKEELRDILCGVEGYFCYEDSNIDCLVRLYELANDCTVDESYWGEDPDCPMALGDFEPVAGQAHRGHRPRDAAAHHQIIAIDCPHANPSKCAVCRLQAQHPYAMVTKKEAGRRVRAATFTPSKVVLPPRPIGPTPRLFASSSKRCSSAASSGTGETSPNGRRSCSLATA